MVWRVKKEESLPEFPEEEEEEDNTKIGSEIETLKKQIKKLEEKEIEPQKVSQAENKNQISKQEVIDIIEGNLNRIVQLVEVLRRI